MNLHGLSDDALFAWLDSATRGCDSADCRVSRVNELYKDTHRVALWPQAFWAGPDPLVVCYDATHLVARVNAVFAKHCATCLLDASAGAGAHREAFKQKRVLKRTALLTL